jgi:F0F1-type ATP synthase assembly protein I
LPQYAANLDWLELHAGVVSAAVVGWFVAANFASVAYYWTFYLILALAAAVRDVSVRTALASQAAGDARKERRAAS